MEQDKIWSYFQAKDSDVFVNSEARYRYLAKKSARGAKILNIGVGRGGLESIFMDNDVVVFSLDPDKSIISEMQKKLGSSERAKVGYSQAIPFGDCFFDQVVLSEVLEHLEDDSVDQTIAEICRVLRPGGMLLGTVPANEVLANERVICPHCAAIFHKWGHVQSFDEARLARLLTKNFASVKVVREYFANYKSLNWKGRIGYWLKRVFMAFGIKGDGESLFFTAVL